MIPHSSEPQITRSKIDECSLSSYQVLMKWLLVREIIHHPKGHLNAVGSRKLIYGSNTTYLAFIFFPLVTIEHGRSSQVFSGPIQGPEHFPSLLKMNHLRVSNTSLSPNRHSRQEANLRVKTFILIGENLGG